MYSCRCATESLLKSSDSAIITVVDEAESAPPADLHSTVILLEPQRSSESSEVVGSQLLVPLCTQSSYSATPELPTKQTRHVELCSSAQPELTPPLSSNSGVALSSACCSGTSSLFIDEIISHSKGKNRAPSIEVSSRGNVHKALDTADFPHCKNQANIGKRKMSSAWFSVLFFLKKFF